MIARLRRLGSRLRRLDGAARRLAGEAVVTLAVARLLVLALPFHRIAQALVAGDRRDDAAAVADAIAIVRMVRGAARVMPVRAMCLEQAVAAAAMLRRRRIAATIHLGTARTPGTAGFEAHAWLSVAGEVILGGPIDRYTELTRFAGGGA